MAVGPQPRDPDDVSIEFPEGRRLRSSKAHRGTSGAKVLTLFIVGLVLGAVTMGAGYWLGLLRGGASPTGPEAPTEATVEMKGIAFVPATITVKPGTKVTWVNLDAVYHTVTSDDTSGPLQSPDILAGQSFSHTFTDEGTYPYHCIPHAFFSAQQQKYLGMVGTVIVSEEGDDGHVHEPIDLPYTWRDPATSPPPVGPTVWDFTLVATELFLPVADGVPFAAWTFDGTIPGPILRVREGDTVNIRLRNEGTMNHSIDFHSARVDWATAYRDVPPGEEHTYSFTADYPGVFMYHCGSAPVLAHVANGMYGVMIVDPLNDTRPPADREYAFVLSEVYASDHVNEDGVYTGDLDKMLAAEPTHVVFNGFAFQYHPGLGGQALPGKTGERIRLYVVNAGPSIVQSFHVIGAIFDRVWIENNPNNAFEGIQTWTLPASGGAAFDLIIPAEGLYPFVTHNFAYTGLGAVGVLQVTP